MKEIFRDHLDLEPEKASPQSTVPMADAQIEAAAEHGFNEARDAGRRQIDMEPERDVDLEPDL